MDFITTKEAAEKWGIGERRVQFFCSNEKIPGAVLFGRQWMIPSDAERPADGRSKNAKNTSNFYPYHFPILIFSKYYSDSSQLCDEEKTLLEAQLKYLKGDYYDSIKLCRSITTYDFIPSLAFGVTVTLAYNFFLSGLYLEFQKCVNKLEKILEKEATHYEDYKLIYNFITHHSTHKSNELFKTDISKLSPDAIDYFHYVSFTISVVGGSKPSEENLLVYETIIRQAQKNNIKPLFLGLCTMIATLYHRKNNSEKTGLFIGKAIKIACENNWLSYFSKYYFPIASLVDSCMKDTNPTELNLLKDFALRNQKNWKKVSTVVLNEMPFEGIQPQDFELLILLAEDMSNKEISSIFGKDEESIKQAIEENCRNLKIRNRKQLTLLAKKLFLSQD